MLQTLKLTRIGVAVLGACLLWGAGCKSKSGPTLRYANDEWPLTKVEFDDVLGGSETKRAKEGYQFLRLGFTSGDGFAVDTKSTNNSGLGVISTEPKKPLPGIKYVERTAPGPRLGTTMGMPLIGPSSTYREAEYNEDFLAQVYLQDAAGRQYKIKTLGTSFSIDGTGKIKIWQAVIFEVAKSSQGFVLHYADAEPIVLPVPTLMPSPSPSPISQGVNWFSRCLGASVVSNSSAPQRHRGTERTNLPLD